MNEKRYKLFSLVSVLDKAGYTVLAEEITNVAVYGDRPAVDELYEALKLFPHNG